MHIETIIRNIVRDEIAASASVLPAEPVLLEPKDVFDNPNYKIPKDLCYDLIKDAANNGFPAVHLGRKVVIDKHRLHEWLRNGGCRTAPKPKAVGNVTEAEFRKTAGVKV